MRPASNEIVIGIIVDSNQNVLIQKREIEKEFGGLWEFPGGKVKVGETLEQALIREVYEETGLICTEYTPLITLSYSYKTQSFLFHLYKVTRFKGTIESNKLSIQQWIPITQLSAFPFPPANKNMVTALQLPELCLITPEPNCAPSVFLNVFEKTIMDGIKLVLLRAKTLSIDQYSELAYACKKICIRYKTKLLINCLSSDLSYIQPDGIHFSADDIKHSSLDGLLGKYFISASCHTEQEILDACNKGVDFIFVAPVLYTQTHRKVRPLGWSRFHILSAMSSVPVYALGGLSKLDVAVAKKYGAVGVAGIRGLWRE